MARIQITATYFYELEIEPELIQPLREAMQTYKLVNHWGTKKFGVFCNVSGFTIIDSENAVKVVTLKESE